MDKIVSLPQKIVEWLSSQNDMDDLTFFVEFPPIKKAIPLRKSIVAVGIENIEITDKFVENDDGVLEKQEYCRLAKIKASLSICVPFSKGGHYCHDIFTRIADALTFRTNLNISKSGCDEVKSDHDTDALVMTGWLIMDADFCPAASTDENYESFLDKTLLCGSHIRNNDIHVNLTDKENWNNPFVFGFYFGMGNSGQTVNLGFKPKFVLICASGSYPIEINFEKSKATGYLGMATQSYTSNGISIVSKGFRVTNSSSSGGISGGLNESGTTFMYVAFK